MRFKDIEPSLFCFEGGGYYSSHTGIVPFILETKSAMDEVFPPGGGYCDFDHIFAVFPVSDWHKNRVLGDWAPTGKASIMSYNLSCPHFFCPYDLEELDLLGYMGADFQLHIGILDFML